MSADEMGGDAPELEPVTLGGIELGNRFALAPMTRVSAQPDGVPTARMAEYYADFARGGFGLVITEGTYTDDRSSQGYLNQPGIVTEAHVEGWKRVTAVVHDAGSPIVLQLMHAGSLSQGNSFGHETVAPSAIVPRGELMPDYGGSGPFPPARALSLSEIEQVKEGFVQSAVNARRAGFDGIEIHAANGYLLDQFLTTYTNSRDDNYGGTVANRIRLTVEIASAIRSAVGPDFIVGVRLSQTKVNDFEYRWPGGADDGVVIYRELAGAGLTYLHIASEGRDWIETARFDTGLTITELARKETGLPVIANGGMHDPEQARQLLTGGHADLLSVGRGALANPDLPNRLKNGTALDPFAHEMLQPLATIENADRYRDRQV